MAAGLRVIRGPDWNLGDDDGGEGHVGTVTEVKDGGKVSVVWDGGEVTLCRAGEGQGHDLRVLDNATVGIRHPHIVCDECEEQGIVGMRWKCGECADYDLCSQCYFSDKHDCCHAFLRYHTPTATPERVERRHKSMKMRVLGIFPEATVQRGAHWQWKDQDGGEGSTGRVLELLTPAGHSARSTVKVEWEGGARNVYRVGYGGRVDLQFTEEAPGLECYPLHLPLLDVADYRQAGQQGERVSDDVTQGDNVVIAVGVTELQQLQKTRSGWAVGMAECVGKVGRVQGFAANGDAIVSFGNKKYRLYPGALKKVGNITVGSKVRILEDEVKVKMLQEGHGGYNDKMKAVLGKVGEVIKVDEDGDVVVRFGQRRWVFAPACCTPAPTADVDIIATDDDDDDVKIRLGGGDGGADLLGLLTALTQATGAQGAGEAVFFKALADRQEALALDLLRKNPALARSETQGFSALHLAANRGLLRVVTSLVEGGVDLNGKDKDGDTPLMSALAGGQAEVAEFLIKKGCGVDERNSDGQTAGHKAALGGFDTVMHALLARRADLNAQDDGGDTPLHDCVSKSKVTTAEVLLSWPGLDLRRSNKQGHPPLHFACMRNEPQIVERILRRERGTANEKKGDGFTPLHVCACNDHHDCMRILIQQGGATVNVVNNERQTPLHVAAHEAARDCVHMLISHGADVNARDSMGNTPLHVTLAGLARGMEDIGMLLLAVLGQGSKVKAETRTQIAILLVQHGADPQATNNLGLSALDACPQGHPEVKDAVQRYISQLDDRRSEALPTAIAGISLGTQGTGHDACRKCALRDAQVLLVPCGHRPLCKECCSGTSRCPECGHAIKTMFDKDGRKVKECIVM